MLHEGWSTARRWTPSSALLLLLALLVAGSFTTSVRAARAPDPLACDRALIDTVADAMRIDGADSNLSTCRRDPSSPDQWIVAIYYVPASAHGADFEDEGRFDLALVIWNTKTVAPVAVFKESRSFEVDYPFRGSTSIDTAKYMLADGVRAFGIRTLRYTSCGGCKWSQSMLSLFVPDGKSLRRVLSTMIDMTTDGTEAPTCQDATRIVKTTIEPAAELSHGWHDLTLTTTAGDESADGPCGARSRTSMTLTYDGANYGRDVKPAPYAD